MPWIEITEILVTAVRVLEAIMLAAGGAAAVITKKIILPIIVGREISENVHLLMITPKKVHIPSAFRTFMKIDLLKTLILKTNPAARRNIW